MGKNTVLKAVRSTIRYHRSKSLSDWVLLLTRGRKIRKSAREILATIDHAGIKKLQQKYHSVTTDDYSWVRYLYPESHMLREVFRVAKYGLAASEPLRILDLGTGAGYFPYVCRHYGHNCVGVDVEEELFGAVAAVLGVDRRIWTVTPQMIDAPIDRRFDLVTAFQVAFDNIVNQADPDPWTQESWELFIRRLEEDFVEPGGRIVLTGVRSCLKGSPYYSLGVRDFFVSLGAKVGNGTVDLVVSDKARGQTKTGADCSMGDVK